MKRIIHIFFASVLILILSSWGYRGHQKISGGVHTLMPEEMSFLVPGWTNIVVTHASDADYRKQTDPNEAPRHYIDIDNYPEFLFTGQIIQNLDSLIAQYGYSYVIDQGILPWATRRTFDSLVSCFQRRDWQNAGLFAADLGHYVGDGHMPLHLTRNYDGQFTGQNGVHSRYESKMINRFSTQITIQNEPIEFVEDVSGYIFDYIYMNYVYVDSILLADEYADSVAGNTYSDLYYQTMWDFSANFTIQLFQRASRSLTELIYTAWIMAGKPVMDPNAIPEPEPAPPVRLFQNYPNPFRSATYIPVEIMDNSTSVTLQVYDVTGTVRTTVVDEKMAPGYYEIRWAPEGLEAGIYYYILKADDVVLTRKMVVMH